MHSLKCRPAWVNLVGFSFFGNHRYQSIGEGVSLTDSGDISTIPAAFREFRGKSVNYGGMRQFSALIKEHSLFRFRMKPFLPFISRRQRQ